MPSMRFHRRQLLLSIVALSVAFVARIGRALSASLRELAFCAAQNSCKSAAKGSRADAGVRKRPYLCRVRFAARGRSEAGVRPTLATKAAATDAARETCFDA